MIHNKVGAGRYTYRKVIYIKPAGGARWKVRDHQSQKSIYELLQMNYQHFTKKIFNRGRTHSHHWTRDVSAISSLFDLHFNFQQRFTMWYNYGQTKLKLHGEEWREEIWQSWVTVENWYFSTGVVFHDPDVDDKFHFLFHWPIRAEEPCFVLFF